MQRHWKEEVKLDLFRDDITIYVENYKKSTKKATINSNDIQRSQDTRLTWKINCTSVYKSWTTGQWNLQSNILMEKGKKY